MMGHIHGLENLSPRWGFRGAHFPRPGAYAPGYQSSPLSGLVVGASLPQSLVLDHVDAHLFQESGSLGLQIRLLMPFFFLVMATVCVSAPRAERDIDRVELKQRALNSLKAAIQNRENPVVRLAAIEALQSNDSPEMLPWIRTSLLDEIAAVRFAACVTLGVLRDSNAEAALRTRLKDDDPGVQVAAIFALHKLGHTDQTARMPEYLLDHTDVTVRRNAALVMGMMDEPGVVKTLARAMKDRDPGVRHHALEAMARLGNRDAAKELAFMTNAGVGSEEVFAVNALAGTRDRIYTDTFRYKLANGPHLETRLAAARGLGLLGDDSGFTEAMRSLGRDRPATNDVNDPPADQILRIRQLAAGAVGAIGRADALPALAPMLADPTDPRLQVSAARAVLDILSRDRAKSLPFRTEQRPPP